MLITWCSVAKDKRSAGDCVALSVASFTFAFSSSSLCVVFYFWFCCCCVCPWFATAIIFLSWVALLLLLSELLSFSLREVELHGEGITCYASCASVACTFTTFLLLFALPITCLLDVICCVRVADDLAGERKEECEDNVNVLTGVAVAALVSLFTLRWCFVSFDSMLLLFVTASLLTVVSVLVDAVKFYGLACLLRRAILLELNTWRKWDRTGEVGAWALLNWAILLLLLLLFTAPFPIRLLLLVLLLTSILFRGADALWLILTASVITTLPLS